MFNFRFKLFLIIILQCLLSRINLIGIDDSSSYFFGKNYKNFYEGNKKDFTNNNIDLFLPVNNKKSKFYKVNEINDTNFNFTKEKNEKDIYIVNEELLKIYEDVYTRDKITNLILKSQRKENYLKNYDEIEEEYSDEYYFYEKKNNIVYDNYYTWQRLINRNVEIIEYSNSKIEKVITTNPDELTLSYKICMPLNISFDINNPKDNENNLIIKSIKTDMYQIKIIPYDSYETQNINFIKYKNHSIKTYLPYSIYPGTKFIFKLLILLDQIGIERGTLYIEFNNNNILMIPITLIGIPNKYNILPIYYYNWRPGKVFSFPIKIHNPNKNVIFIKNVIHSFKNISVLWPNGVSVSSNSTSITTSMLQIQPNSTKNLIYLKFYSENEGFEYGLLHLTIDKNKLLIPILINIDFSPLNFFPSFINFGVCDISTDSIFNIRKLIPLEVTNNENYPLKISNVYLNYEEKFLQFYNIFNDEDIILKPHETIKFGYLIFNGKLDNYVESFNEIEEIENLYKNNFGSIFIETNSTYKSMIELLYSYYLDYNSVLNIENKSSDLKDEYFFEFAIDLNLPFGIELNRKYQQGEFIEFKLDNSVSAIYLNPYFMNESYSIDVFFNISENSYSNFTRYYFFPLQISYRLYSLIPLKINNNNIDLLYCGYKKYNSFHDCYSSNKNTLKKNVLNNNYITYINLDLGIITYNQLLDVSFYLINENDETININSIEIDNPLISIDFIEDSFFNVNNIKFDNNNWKKIKLSNILRKKENKIIFGGNNYIKIFDSSAVKFSLNILNSIINEFKTNILFEFSTKKKLNLNLKGIALQGNLNLTPSIVRFEPSFPGLFLEDKIINIKSTYNHYLQIKSIESSNNKIIPKLETNIIFPNDKRILMKVHFNPYNANLEEDIIMEMNPMENYITYRELYLWKVKQKLWEEAKTEINENITIKTDCTKDNIRIRASLAKPSLVKNDQINFGLVQIGKTNEKYINCTNPSDMTMTFKLMLASEEYSDIHNNNMFNNNDRYQFNSLNKLFVVKCLYSNNPLLNFNNMSNYIIIEEEIDEINLNTRKFNKYDFINKLIEYGNKEVQKNILESNKIICEYFIKLKNEIILEKNEENNFLVSKLFSKNFSEKISIIKDMTDRQLINSNTKFTNNNKSIIQKFLNRVFSFFSLFIFPSQEELYEIYLKSSKKNKQSFFIPKSLSSQTFTVLPHQKFLIGPIKYHPFDSSKSSATLFIKNNLTILYPIKLNGEGGTGKINFVNHYQYSRNKKMRLINNSKLIIDIDKDVFEYEMENNENITRIITLTNVGNLNMEIKNISIENSGCEAFGIKILQCEEFNLKPGENIDIDIMIKPNFNFYTREKNIVFYSDYQIISLKIVININKEIIILKNKLFNLPHKNHTSIISGFIIFFIMKIVINLVKLEVENDKNIDFGTIEIIYENNNNDFIIENLFIKVYKKENKRINEDIAIKQIENLNTKDENDNNYKRNKRRKSRIKNKFETETDNKKDSINEGKESINSSKNTTDNEVNKRKQSNISNINEDKKNKNYFPPFPNNIKNKKNKHKRNKKPIGMETDKDSNNGDNQKNNNINHNENMIYISKNLIPINNNKFDYKFFKRQNSWKSESNISLPYQKHFKTQYKNNNNSNKFNVPIDDVINGKKINNLHDLFSSEQESENNKNSQNNKIEEKIKSNNKSNPKLLKVNKNINENKQKEIINNDEKSKFELIENDINPIFLSEKKERQNIKKDEEIEKIEIKPNNLNKVLDDEIEENKNIESILNFLDISTDENKNKLEVKKNKSQKKNSNNKEECFSENEKLKIDNKITVDKNMKMNQKIYFSGNELTDEEIKDSLTKPYFKNLLNNAFNHNKIVYSDPFRHNNNKGKLGKLIEDNKKEDKKENKKIEEKSIEEGDKIIESNDDDDINEFDRFKLIEMDFNFNLI